MSVKPEISSFEWYHQKCADCIFVPLFYEKRSPNPIVKTALLQTTSTKSTLRKGGDYLCRAIVNYARCRRANYAVLNLIYNFDFKLGLTNQFINQFSLRWF